MLKKIMIVVLILASLSCIHAQNNKKEKSKSLKYQIGLNITDAISNLVNVADNASAIDPYTFDFRVKGKKNIYRIGLKVKYRKNDTRLFPFSVDRNLTFIDLQTRVGFQKNMNIYKKLDLFWGIDLVAGYENEVSESFVISDALRNTELLYSIGTGPVLGFEYHLNNRFSISTYSSLYYTFSYENKELKELDNDNLLEASNGYIHDIEHILPNSIFFHFSF